MLNIDHLNGIPDEIKRNIYGFIHKSIKSNLNKTNYLNNRKYKIQNINYKQQNNYVRWIIRNDKSELFDYYLNNIVRASNVMRSKRFLYNGKIYTSKYNFLNALCIEFTASNCRNILRMYALKLAS